MISRREMMNGLLVAFSISLSALWTPPAEAAGRGQVRRTSHRTARRTTTRTTAQRTTTRRTARRIRTLPRNHRRYVYGGRTYFIVGQVCYMEVMESGYVVYEQIACQY